MRCGDPLAGEVLGVFDRVFGSVCKESANDLNALVVGDVDGRFLMVGFAVDVLRGLVYVVKWARGLA